MSVLQCAHKHKLVCMCGSWRVQSPVDSPNQNFLKERVHSFGGDGDLMESMEAVAPTASHPPAHHELTLDIKPKRKGATPFNWTLVRITKSATNNKTMIRDNLLL